MFKNITIFVIETRTGGRTETTTARRVYRLITIITTLILILNITIRN